MKRFMPKHTFPALASAMAVIVLLSSVSSRGAESEEGFIPLFDGTSLKGWHVSSKTGHSRASNQQSGGKWVVENGAIVGSQDLPGNGGILLTDATFGDFEVALEMNNDFGPDSGLFLRSTEDGTAFQAMIDYHAQGNLMGLYGEGRLGARPSLRSFSFLETVTEIQEHPMPTPPSLPVRPEAWSKFWRHGQWNELRARITGNPPAITTWINGVKFIEWQDPEGVRHPDRGPIALQVHGGGDFTRQFVRYRNIRVKSLMTVPDNQLSETERAEGWQLLFDGKSTAGWMNSDRTEPRTPVQYGSLNPHRAGHYMLVHTQQWSNFILKLDFRLSPHCNSGVFLRTSTLTPRPGRDVGFNGLEIALDDTQTAGFHDSGALYDLSRPKRNAMRPIGEWNQLQLTARGSMIEVVMNGEKVNEIDLSKFTQANRRPDGSEHKFDVVYKDHPPLGYIGLQDHGSSCWYKNIKLKPLP